MRVPDRRGYERGYQHGYIMVIVVIPVRPHSHGSLSASSSGHSGVPSCLIASAQPTRCRDDKTDNSTLGSPRKKKLLCVETESTANWLSGWSWCTVWVQQPPSLYECRKFRTFRHSRLFASPHQASPRLAGAVTSTTACLKYICSSPSRLHRQHRHNARSHSHTRTGE